MPEAASPGEPPLTPTERLLLEWSREGALDAEVAVRLSTSVGDVKQRYERLLRRSGTASRDELRRWDPDNATESPAEALPGAPLEASRSFRARIAAAALAIAIVAAAGAAGWLLIGKSSTAPGALPPRLVVAPTPVATVAGVTVEPLRSLAASDFPTGVMLYVVTGCPGCETAPSGLDRIWRDQDDVLHADTVFRAPAESGSRISGVAASVGATELAVSVVAEGPSGRGLSDSLTLYYRSTDGGVSWAEVAASGGTGAVVRVLEGGVWLVREATPAGETTLRILPVGVPQDGAVVAVLPEAPPPEFAFIESLGADVVAGLQRVVAGEGGFVFAWHPVSPFPDATDTVVRIGKASPSGDVERIFQHVGSPLALGPWLDKRTVVTDLSVYLSAQLIAKANFTHLPALIDIEDGTIQPIGEPFTSRRYVEGGNLVIATSTGPFAKVGARPRAA